MKPGNTVTLKQLNDAIAANRFTMKDSTATVAGTVVITEGKVALRISGTNEVLQMAAESDVTVTAASGKAVVVEGTIPEGVKGKTPVSIRYHAMTEER